MWWAVELYWQGSWSTPMSLKANMALDILSIWHIMTK